MALRDQPYLPLYVQDFLTDEKLVECSASSNGVYIRIMCILHKSNTYGCILLKQKDKQKESNIVNFATKLAKQMPYGVDEIITALTELINERVLTLEDDLLYQKRMRNDGIISEKRSLAGKKGASKKKELADDFAIAKPQANSEYEYDNENEYINEYNIFTFIEKEFGRTLSPTEYEIISEWEDNDLTKYAIKTAILNGVPNLKYIQAILDSYKLKNIKSVQDAQLEEEKFKKNKNSKKEKPLPEWTDKKIEKEQMSVEEEQEMKDLLSEFK